MDIYILLAHGSPEKEADSTDAVAARLHEMMHPRCSEQCVRVAYLQFMKPGLADAVHDAVAAGATRIIVHPFLLSSGFHVNRSIPDLLRTVREQYPQTEFICTEPLGAHEGLAAIVLERIKAAQNRGNAS